MGIPPGNAFYSSSSGTGSTNFFIPVLSTRAPTTADTNYQLTQRWIVTTSGDEYMLLNWTSSGGVLAANWLILGYGSTTVIQITGDSGVALPATGNINLLAAPTGLSFTGSGSTLTLGGTLTVSHGGTGVATLTGVLTGNGTSAITGNAITQYGVLVAGASNAVSSITPDASTTKVLVSGGAAANPSWQTIASGALSLGAFGSTPNSNAASLSGSTLTLQPADGTNPGGVSTLAQTFAGVKTFSSAPNFSSLTSLQALVLDGSKNVTTMAYSASGGTLNLVSRDANSNTITNNFISQSTSTPTSGGTTALTVGSTRLQIFTGTLTQTITLPNATTMNAGGTFEINNNSTGALTVNDNTGSLVTTVVSGGYARIVCTNTGSPAGVWDKHFLIPANGVYGTAGLTITGTLASGSSGTQFTVDSSGNVNAGTWAATTVTVNHGGTGIATTTAYAPICGGTTATGAFQAASSGQSNVGYVLTSTGASSLPTWQAAGAADFKVIIQTFTSNGTYTPTAGMVYCIIEVVGGGGGGGSSANTGASQVSAGGGGGGGGYARKYFTAATIGASQSVTVGSGGSGGVSGGAAPTSGGTTSVGALISATGGSPGVIGAAAAAVTAQGGGAGGSGSSGSFNTTGTPGGISFALGALSVGYGGNGGSSFFGGGAPQANGTSGVVAGQASTSYGGGGGGALTLPSSAGQNGGAGFGGIVVVTEFVFS